ncbi:hypothetical protein [Methylobacterium tardum]|uniref:hypothetical protein n=1 Tax=Methylobacterium tardum TaxID=374432 RepID=UPI001EE0C5C8|nr:hypothetical protein [Methylobacterium tardum]URD37867.1 hypothetical protein M6G65_04870 [Methylobacterium tardum]
MANTDASTYSEPHSRAITNGVGASIERFVKLLSRSKYVLSGWILFCLILAAFYINATAPVYTATGTLLLDPRRSTTISSDAPSIASQITLDNAQAESQLQVVRSERLLAKVFQALNLETVGELHPKGFNVRETIEGLFRLHSSGLIKQDADQRRREIAGAFQNFMSRVGARRVGQSYVIEVSYTSSSPNEARRLANAVLSAFLSQQISYKLAAAQNGAEYLQGRIISLNNQLKAADQALSDGRVPDNFMPDADARIIGAASEPLGRAWPKSGLIFAATFAFSTFIGVLFVVIYGSLDRKIRSPAQVEEVLKLNVITCGLRKKKRIDRLNALSMPNKHSGEQAAENILHPDLRSTITEIELAITSKEKWSVGFISCGKKRHGAVIVESFFDIIRRFNKNLVLVDLFENMRGLFTAESEGVRNIQFEAAPADAIETKSFEPIWLMGGGGYISGAYIREVRDTASTALNTPAMIIKQMNRAVPIVIDLGCSGLGAEYRAMTGVIDHVFIICELGVTTIPELAEMKRNILKSNSKADIHIMLTSER